jgi:hypothetical protein
MNGETTFSQVWFREAGRSWIPAFAGKTGWLVLSALLATPAQASPSYTVIPGSTVAYHVKARLIGLFDENIDGVNREVKGSFGFGPDGKPTGWVAAPTLAFRSGIKGRDANVREMLGGDRHPDVRFDLLGLEPINPPRPSGTLIASGLLHANGHSQSIRFPLTYRLADHILHLSGEADARFTDFTITPPVLGFVLKRAPNALKLRVDLVAREEDDQH